MSADETGIRFETDPVVFELQREGWKELQEVVLLVPRSLGRPEPGRVTIEPPTTEKKFRFVADPPEWEAASDDPEDADRLTVRVVCSGGQEGEQDSALLTVILGPDVKAQVRLVAGVNCVLPLSEVLREEYRELRPDLAEKLDEAVPPGGGTMDVGMDEERVRKLYGVLHKDSEGLAAVCFSGGGIRSATFNFGILQGLATLGLLGKFDYLSTVSGGGYIGSWLSSWIHRSGAGEVMPKLAAPLPDPECPEPAPVSHLRRYSNYLTPKLGVLSADTWTLVSIVIRNLLLNALVLLPALAALLALPLLALSRVPRAWDMKPDALFGIAFALGTIGLFFENLLRASAVARPGVKSPAWTRAFLPLGLLPLLAGTAFLVVAVDRFAPSGAFTFGEVFLRCAIWAIAMPLLAYLAAVVLQKPLLGRRQAFPVSDISALLMAGAVITCVYSGILAHWAGPLVRMNLYLYPILGPGLILGPLLLGKTLFIAFASPAAEYTRGPSTELGDADREWWARWSAWILIVTVSWTIGSALVYFSPFLLHETEARLAAWLSASGLGALTSLLAKSGQTDKDGNASPWRRWALAIAAPLFCLVLLIVISDGSQQLMGKVFSREASAKETKAANDLPVITAAVAEEAPPTAASAATGKEAAGTAAARKEEEKKKKVWLTSPAAYPPFMGKLWQVLLTIGALYLLGAAMGYFINVNRFSLQAMYRNRLVRAYLGASNTRRRPNLFTGFDPEDNVRMHELRQNRPLHVVNMALNLVAGKELAWQERRAECFTATPLHCGAARLGYRRSQVYGGPRGISLGTAMATSGAAANPNMGFYSSAPVTFIMTLFNARLGIWLGNPGKIGRFSYTRTGPRFSNRVIFGEALGQTDSSHPYINLSDGGHFENLGLYEVVRRRCRFIVVCDAGGDPTVSFNDLGNAIRKIRIDLGIPIDFKDRIHIFPKPAAGAQVPPEARYAALGRIHYDQVDGKDAPMGTILYIKPAICDNEPYDVVSYAKDSATFPHETTADQWFSESQFESYRVLGRAALLKIAGYDPAHPATLPDLAAFEAKVEAYLSKPEPAMPKVEVILPPGILATSASAAVQPLPGEGNGGAQPKQPGIA
jgi:hypothetical protein